jgi:hypothetical protein
MISLDDPRWSELAHAYGSAADIPALLSALTSSTGRVQDYRAEPWFSLWSSLCHQGDVYTASYAAVPHIVEIAMQARGPVHSGFFSLPAAIELARDEGRGPEIPIDLEKPYREALAKLIDCVALHRHEDWDEDMLLSAITAQAVAKGHYEMGRALLNLDSDLIATINAGEFFED